MCTRKSRLCVTVHFGLSHVVSGEPDFTLTHPNRNGDETYLTRLVKMRAEKLAKKLADTLAEELNYFVFSVACQEPL